MYQQMLSDHQMQYRLIKQNYPEDKIKSLVAQVIEQHILKVQKKKQSNLSENDLNKKNFYIAKCMDRVNQQWNVSIQQFLLEYNWLFDDPRTEYNRIFEYASGFIRQQTTSLISNIKLDKFIELQTLEQEKRKKKKRKKKAKRLQEKLEQEKQEQEQGQLQQLENLEQQEQKVEQNEKKVNNSIFKQKINEISRQQAEKKWTIEQKLISNDQKNTLFQEEQGQEIFFQAPSEKNRNNELLRNKTVKSRINSYLQNFSQFLIEQSNGLEKYRKIVYNLISQFVQKELKIVGEWQLILYGSSAAKFALKSSDLDLVLLSKDPSISLELIFQLIKGKPWTVNVSYIPAKVPIIQMLLNLSHLENMSQKLSSRSLKKISDYYFKVDLTLDNLGSVHTGMQNTKHLSSMLDNNPSLLTIGILVKEYLRIKNLNKPYQGGISSYILVVMLYNILKEKNIIKSSDFCFQIEEICHYLTNKFIPFQTLISCVKNTQVKIDPSVHLNIEDPHTESLLKTSAFKMDKIIDTFNGFLKTLKYMQEELLTINLNEKKKMKKKALRILQELYHPEQYRFFVHL